MADTIKPTTVVVDGGSGSDDSSENNTILEIADQQKIDRRVLIKLNPHLISNRRIHNKQNPVYLKYKDPKTNKEVSYKIPADKYLDGYALSRICARINGWDKGDAERHNDGLDLKAFRGQRITEYNSSTAYYHTQELIDHLDNYQILSKYVKFDPGDAVITSFGSMTESVDSFRTYTYTVTDPKSTITLEKIAKMEHEDVGKVSLTTLMDLNPSVSQTEPLEWGTIILLGIAGPEGQINTCKIDKYGIKADTTRTCYIEWSWDNKNNKTQHYEVKWEYQDSSGKWWEAEKSTTSDDKIKIATYNADENAVEVKASVRPVLESGFKLFGSTSSTELEYSEAVYFKFNGSVQALVPSVGIPEFKKTDNDNYKLTMSAAVDMSIIRDNEKVAVQFQVLQDHSKVVYTNAEPEFINITNADGTITHSCELPIGHVYQVRARTKRTRSAVKEKNIEAGSVISAWCSYSESVQAPPSNPTDLNVKVMTATSVQLSFAEIPSAEKYIAEFVVKNDEDYPGFTPERYFSTPTISKQKAEWYADDVDDKQVYFLREESYSDGSNTKRIIGADLTGLATGGEYYIRLSAENGSWVNPSGWSEIIHFAIGIKPEPPTTWSSTHTAVVGEPVKLYWIHNAKDESTESHARLQMFFNNEQNSTWIEYIDHEIFRNDDGTYETSFYELDTNKYPVGSKIEWEVQTAGVAVDTKNDELIFSDWSKRSEINIYKKPVLTLNLTDDKNNDVVGHEHPLMQFPLVIKLGVDAGDNQIPTGYYVSIDVVRTDSSKLRNGIRGYSSTDSSGNSKWISEGDKIFARHIDTNDKVYDLKLWPNDIILESGVTYRVSALASMDSGLNTDIQGTQFRVSWSSTDRAPFADIVVDRETITTQIMPYAPSTQNVRLSVYRRNHDDSFIEIGSNIDPKTHEVVVDPHPPLDYARYRIVSRNQNTGAISYYDVPPVAIQEKAIIIQWDEVWQTYNAVENSDNIPSSAIYSGNMLKLPYNIDVSNSNSIDVSHVRYIGRKRPVSYYGTQLGESVSWNVEVPKSDTDTLYKLRRLQSWLGDVYVREPSGSGYWATINISFNLTHCALTIPVSINITPVEGGK